MTTTLNFPRISSRCDWTARKVKRRAISILLILILIFRLGNTNSYRLIYELSGGLTGQINPRQIKMACCDSPSPGSPRQPKTSIRVTPPYPRKRQSLLLGYTPIKIDWSLFSTDPVPVRGGNPCRGGPPHSPIIGSGGWRLQLTSPRIRVVDLACESTAVSPSTQAWLNGYMRGGLL